MDKDAIIEGLKADYEESHANAAKAAEIGKILLEENVDLKDRMEELRITTDRKLELAEQEKHTLQTKLDQKAGMDAWYNEEISHLKQQVTDVEKSIRDTMEAEKTQEVTKLTRQLEELRTDLDVAGCTEQQLRDKNRELEDLLQERLSQTEVSGSRSFMATEELGDLQEEVNTLQCEVTSLKSQLIEKRTVLQSKELEVEALKCKLAARDEELEEVKCHFCSLSNAIEEARMEKMDLKCQLDALRMETSGHRKKGNSIFSELDDRRIESEKKLISLKVMNDTLKEKYQVEKQQNQKYKRQISQLLLELSSGRVDSEYVANLESKLSQARQEVRTLMEEKSNLQDKKQAEVMLMSELDCSKVKNGDYVQYLVTLIEGKEQELQKSQQELSHKTLQLLDEKSRTSSQECKLQQIEAEKDKLRSQNMKLSLKMEELRLKYEPDAVKKSGALVVKRTEKIPTDEPEQVKITETSRVHSHTSYLLNNSKLSQSIPSSNKETLYSKSLLENVYHSTSKLPVSNFIKKKTVSISDDVEEHNIERDNTDSENKEMVDKPRQKRTRITAEKHMSKDRKEPDVNECKSQ